MRQIFPDLWQSSAERPIPNMPNVVSNAYLLTRASGNVLFYNIGREGALPAENSADLSHIDDLGGISLQLLGHWHEASPSPGRETLLDIDVIPTPGHTAGSVSFRYRSPHGRTYLFTGDAIVPSGNGWTAAPLRESDRTKLRESLTLLGSLKPDVVIAAAAVGTGTLQEVTEESWRQAIDGAERSMRRRAA